MYMYNLESNNFSKMIENNKFVIIGVYEKNSIISDLFKGLLNKINNTTDKKTIVSLIERNEYHKINRTDEKQIFPILLFFKNGIKIKEIYGFYNYSTVFRVMKNI